MEIFGKTAYSGRIWPDWGNTARADMAGLGSIGLILSLCLYAAQYHLHIENIYNFLHNQLLSFEQRINNRGPSPLLCVTVYTTGRLEEVILFAKVF